jgi:hypothetical protein
MGETVKSPQFQTPYASIIEHNEPAMLTTAFNNEPAVVIMTTEFFANMMALMANMEKNQLKLLAKFANTVYDKTLKQTFCKCI